MDENNELKFYSEKAERIIKREDFHNKLPETFDLEKQRNYVLDLLIYGEAKYGEPKNNQYEKKQPRTNLLLSVVAFGLGRCPFLSLREMAAAQLFLTHVLLGCRCVGANPCPLTRRFLRQGGVSCISCDYFSKRK